MSFYHRRVRSCCTSCGKGVAGSGVLITGFVELQAIIMIGVIGCVLAFFGLLLAELYSPVPAVPITAPVPSDRSEQGRVHHRTSSANQIAPARGGRHNASRLERPVAAAGPAAFPSAVGRGIPAPPGLPPKPVAETARNLATLQSQAGPVAAKRGAAERKRAPSITGRVFDEAGQALSGIEVVAKAVRADDSSRLSAPAGSAELRAWTGQFGGFRFPDLASGDYQLVVVGDADYAPARTIVRVGAYNVNLVLARLQRLQVVGYVLDGAGAPVQGVAVTLRGRAAAEPAYSDAQGSYALELQVAGSDRGYSVAFEHPDYQREIRRFRRSAFQGVAQLRFDAVLQPLVGMTTVTGQVRGSAGEPLAGQVVKLSSAQVQRSHSAVTDENGRFSIAEVALADDYRLLVRPHAIHRNYDERNLVVQGAGVHLPIMLEPLEIGSLSGQMLDTGGNPLPGLTLWLRSRGSNRDPIPVTGDSYGNFHVAEAPSGWLGLKSRSAPYLAAKAIYLPAGDDIYAELVFDLGPHELRGRVVDSAGEPVAASAVKLLWNHTGGGVSSSTVRQTVADEQGYFHFTRLGPGRHQIRVDNVTGFRMRQIAYEVGRGGTDEVTVTLEERF